MFKDPVFVSLFLLIFGFFWILLCAVLSWQTGWSAFAKRYPFADSIPLQVFHFSTIQFNQIGSYSYGIAVSIHKDGIGIEPHLLFKAFHKPFFIKWEDISNLKEGKEFFWYPVVDVLVEDTKIRFYGKAIDPIKVNVSKR